MRTRTRASTTTAATVVVLLLGGGALLSAMPGCKPDIGAPPSLVDGPRLLDLLATPPEAKPGSPFMLDALMVDTSGMLAAPVAWTTCLTPTPPAESNAVSRACVDMPDAASPAAGPQMLTMPSDACSRFGPVPPAPLIGQPAVRPRDPDDTDGFYQPVRAAVRDVSGGGGDLLGFALVRISCGLANAPTEILQQFTQSYTPNSAPAFASLTVTDSQGLTSTVGGPAMGPAPSVHAHEAVVLAASWADEAAEHFPVFDIANRQLVDQREALRIAWFTSAGELLHDRTGRTANDTVPSTDNTWTAPAVDGPTTVHFWVVLRDSRGGSTFAAFDLFVSP